jgi:hypothetical protein
LGGVAPCYSFRLATYRFTRRADRPRNQLHTATVSRRNRQSVKHPDLKLLADTVVEKKLELIDEGPVKAAEDHDVQPM